MRPATDGRKFAFDPFLKEEYRYKLDPKRPICRFYAISSCPRGRYCPDRHALPAYSNKVVCRHWLKGLCKKGDHCEFLHEYNIRKLPECSTYVKTGSCPLIPDCPYAHVDPESKVPLCTAYERGFCRQGPTCQKRHLLRVMCPNYLTGFCPDGPLCQLGHPRFVQIDDTMRIALDPAAKPQWQIEREAQTSTVATSL
ncbi:mRNA 3'-end-processing protein YTH1 [Wickerhamiella sorbophila]|uniref:mRNA 3'-end-processing protein n=1 Tax=Wickerhamiella sorbophila TaxID=45607 RepID=A0A2T0FJ27_9ASCO|nr:mRNA 3'-end-processing protein YTH1 [Wickerhamiella sorbophila]PRT54976.1 mRNA 3'-end-processing protein YTH1 [Wickerhamiella sorbophila]